MSTYVLRGRRYRVVYTTLPDDRDGDCDSPKCGRPEIRINSALTGQKKAQTLMHESLHACLWDASEDAVTETAVDVTKLLKGEGVL